MEDYIMWELMGGGSPKHFNTFSNFFLIVHFTYIIHCYVLLLLLTVPMYTMLSTII